MARRDLWQALREQNPEVVLGRAPAVAMPEGYRLRFLNRECIVDLLSERIYGPSPDPLWADPELSSWFFPT